MQPAKQYLHLLATQGLCQVGKFLERLAVHDLRVAKTEDEDGGAVSAVFVDGFDYLINVLVKVKETDGA